nr:hypothetical protein [Tanacetum cinerariifolium]
MFIWRGCLQSLCFLRVLVILYIFLIKSSAIWGPSVGMKPLPAGTLVSPASTVATSIEVKTLAISSKSLLILLAAASPSLLLLPLIGASSPDLSLITPSLSSKILTLSFNLLGNSGNGSTGNRWKWN